MNLKEIHSMYILLRAIQWEVISVYSLVCTYTLLSLHSSHYTHCFLFSLVNNTITSCNSHIAVSQRQYILQMCIYRECMILQYLRLDEFPTCFIIVIAICSNLHLWYHAVLRTYMYMWHPRIEIKYYSVWRFREKRDKSLWKVYGMARQNNNIYAI